MSPVVLILVTMAILVVELGRRAFLERSRGPVEQRVPSRHPLVLLAGSVLSLMAVYSLVRLLPPEAASGWPVLAHVGFLCLWLVLMATSSGSKQ